MQTTSRQQACATPPKACAQSGPRGWGCSACESPATPPRQTGPLPLRGACARSTCRPAAQPRLAVWQGVVPLLRCSSRACSGRACSGACRATQHMQGADARQGPRRLTVVCACRSHRCSRPTPAPIVRPVDSPGPWQAVYCRACMCTIHCTPQCMKKQQEAHIDVVARAEVAHPDDIPH